MKAEKSHGMVVATAEKRRPAKREECDIERVSIEKAGNGFMVSTHLRPKKDKGDCHLMWPEPEKSVFTDAGSMAKHIAGVFGEASE